MTVVLAVDIGGTKPAAGLVDEDGALVASARTAMAVTDDAQALCAVVMAVAASVGGNAEVVALSVQEPRHIPAFRTLDGRGPGAWPAASGAVDR